MLFHFIFGSSLDSFKLNLRSPSSELILVSSSVSIRRELTHSKLLKDLAVVKDGAGVKNREIIVSRRRYLSSLIGIEWLENLAGLKPSSFSFRFYTWHFSYGVKRKKKNPSSCVDQFH